MDIVELVAGIELGDLGDELSPPIEVPLLLREGSVDHLVLAMLAGLTITLARKYLF